MMVSDTTLGLKYDYARLNEAHIAKADFTSKGFVLAGEGQELTILHWG